MNEQYIVTIEFIVANEQAVSRIYHFHTEKEAEEYIERLREDYKKKRFKYHITLQKEETSITLLAEYKSN